MNGHDCTERERMERMEEMLMEMRTDLKEIKKHLYIGNGTPSIKAQVEQNTAFRKRFETALDGLAGKLVALVIVIIAAMAAISRVWK